VVKESKHSLWGCLGALICPWLLHLMVPMFDTLDVVYVHGGLIGAVPESDKHENAVTRK